MLSAVTFEETFARQLRGGAAAEGAGHAGDRREGPEGRADDGDLVLSRAIHRW